ncbi:unnamed protein product [Hymenolepis diminuta]|uniref:Uncharacterized protein n=1 Tax=Hymenolepis diminuta TaxID=6216 RepID=A0A564Z454_HYMDI|nr:unnamed protein product [Hymenolepis diminuta]
MAATRKIIEHCQRSAHSLTHSLHLSLLEECTTWHGMMYENRGKSMCNTLSNIFKCLKAQSYTRNVLHQHLGCKSHVLR